MKNQKRLWLKKNNKKKHKILFDDDEHNKIVIKNKKFLKSKKLAKSNKANINVHFIMKFILLIIILIIFLTCKKNKKEKEKEKEVKSEIKNEIKKENKTDYYACFSGMGKMENKYIRELIEYYLKLGVEKFILGDNNLPNTEKFADVIQDYINDGTVDVIDLIGSTFGQSALNNLTYEKYNKKCKWMLFLDFDEYLEVHFENNKSLVLKDFIENKIFDKCEAVLFNVLVHTDNNLVHYDNRPLNVRFTEPHYNLQANNLVKAIVRGNLNKTVFVDGKPNNTPVKGVEICDSKGRKITKYDSYFLIPPVFDYGYLKHFTTKTAEEYITKILKGTPGGHPHNVDDRIKIFFEYNKFSEEKLKIFENYFNRSFRGVYNE